MHAHNQPLPHRPRRVLVAGVSGAGKTTLAGRIAEITGGPHLEIDAIFHGPDWTPRPEFVHDVRCFVSGDDWTTEWQYDIVRWAIRTRRKYTELMPRFINEYPHVTVVRLRSQREADEWLRHSLLPAVTG
jgi:hypothetical protein